jgi:hypothetical protein
VATYSGDATFLGSTSAPATITILKQTPSVTVQVAVPQGNPGDPITFSAAVFSSAPANGTVAFSDGSTVIAQCAAVALSTSVALCKTNLVPGIHTIAAQYSGDTFNTASTGTVSVSVK